MSNGKGKAVGVRYWKCFTSGRTVSTRTQDDRLTEINGCLTPGDHGHVNDNAKISNMIMKVSCRQCLWCLLPHKQQHTYERLFHLLQLKAHQRNLQLQPTTIHMDFEQAVIQAVQGHFGISGISPTKCMFHFDQSILCHVHAVGLQTAYKMNTPPEVRISIRRLLALPLVPPIRLDQAFQAIIANSPNVPGHDLMNDYVRKTYMDSNRVLYDCSIWNCFGTHDRTTNVCEGYHSVLNTHSRGRHPDPYAFFQFIQQQDSELERSIQLEIGTPARKRKAKYLAVDAALDRLLDGYFTGRMPNVGQLLTYVDAAAHQLHDVKH
jgi:hypothetical protein